MRTLPERSEFRGGVREAELHEEGSRTGSLHRTKFCSEKGTPRRTISGHRKLSSASSPSSYKVWTAEEEEEMDHDGYVLAGSCVTPQRGKLPAYSDLSHDLQNCFVSEPIHNHVHPPPPPP